MDKIAILDFGGQYAHLIANRIRRLKVYSEILESNTPALNLREYKGLIFSGGPQSVYEENAPQCDPKILSLNIPILGICYGHQLLSHVLGGKVSPGKVKEYGLTKLKVSIPKGIFKGFSEKETIVWMSHGDEVSSLPEGFEILAKTEVGENAAIGNFEKNIYGVQFHVEVTHTMRGMDILSNFLDICGCKRDWNMAKFLEEELKKVVHQVGKRKVFFLVSGGVDSTVAFTLLNRALGEKRVYGLFVDTGFMRKDEGQEVEKSLVNLGYHNFHAIDASKEFFEALKDTADPEQKRKIIGQLFLKVQRDAVKKLKMSPKDWMLGQGTIYPDTIESGGTKHADKIKTHHNRVPEIQEMMEKGLVVEPLKELYKDEVRIVGEKLGLPHSLVWRHPFPGPGLAVRCLCADMNFGRHHDDSARREEEKKIQVYLKKTGFQARILPILSVGVQGDARTYRHPLVLFGQDFDWDDIEKLSTELTNRFFGINRVLVLISPDKITSLEMVFPAHLIENRVQFLQNSDAIVSKFLIDKKLEHIVWQFPVCLLPIKVNDGKNESIVLRPVESEEAMTANFFKMPKKLLQELVQKLTAQNSPSAIFYDITNKPPGTIEWE